MAVPHPQHVPVIIGVGESIDRPVELARALEPAALMTQALLAAAADATGSVPSPLLGAIDSLDIVAEHSWPYSDPCRVLADRIGHTPRRCVYGVTGGETPVRYIHDAALRIAEGESTVAAVVGGEAQHSVTAAAKQSFSLSWSPRDANARLIRGKDFCHPIAVSHGMVQPVHVYPLYENAATAAWGQTQAEAMRESAELWSRFAKVAAANPCAWLNGTYSAEDIAEVGPTNRLIAWPYTKHMVANPFVNQGAAIILTSLEKARELRVPEHQIVYVHAGASAMEPRDYLQRDQYQRSAAQEAVLVTLLEAAGNDATRFSWLELYSCFPIVPRMARRVLGLAADAQLTSTGGLSFFGAPLNNYMTHAAAGLVRRLRGHPDQLALLYGQGEFVTKHHALMLGSSPCNEPLLTRDYDVQARADERRKSAPTLLSDYSGPAALETFTIVYDRTGQSEYGTVIARTPKGQRLMARVNRHNASTLGVLTDISSTPIGRTGLVSRGSDELSYWTVT